MEELAIVRTFANGWLLGNKKRFYWINEQQAKFNFIDQVPDPVSAKPSDLKVFDELNLMHISFYGKYLIIVLTKEV